MLSVTNAACFGPNLKYKYLGKEILNKSMDM